ncbi:hypothetical protein FBU30_001784 [Linnemannia zychae]|nr:hypothetical protein FBU30_001784 [Linnemannia zychae]
MTKTGPKTSHSKRNNRPPTSRPVSDIAQCRPPAGPSSQDTKAKRASYRISKRRSNTCKISLSSATEPIALTDGSNTTKAVTKKSSKVSVPAYKKDNTLFKQLCQALANASNQDRASSSHPEKEHRGRCSTSSSKKVGGQFGFLALGPLSPNTGIKRASNHSLPSTPTVERARSTKVPTFEDLETLIYSNPLDIEPKELIPPRLERDDLLPSLPLPIFNNCPTIDNWQYQQPLGNVQGSYQKHTPDWYRQFQFLYTVPSLASSSSSLSSSDFEGWNTQSSASYSYEHLLHYPELTTTPEDSNDIFRCDSYPFPVLPPIPNVPHQTMPQHVDGPFETKDHLTKLDSHLIPTTIIPTPVLDHCSDFMNITPFIAEEAKRPPVMDTE